MDGLLCQSSVTNREEAAEAELVRRNRIAIIGAGVGGLSAAAILSRRFDVDVFEKAPAPGGKMRQIRTAGAAIDSGPTVFTMDWAFEEVFRLAGSRLRDRVGLSKLDRLARHYWPGGDRLDLFADTGASADAISAFAGPEDAANYLAFCQESQRVYETLLESFMLRPRPSFLGLLAQNSPRVLLETSPFRTLWSRLGRRFRDPRLRQLFGRYATYCGASPFEAPATLMLVAHVEQAGVWSIHGGMQALATALHDVAVENGARFHFETEVEEILVSAGRAYGVRLACGDAHAADFVVMNGDVAALANGAIGAPAARAVRYPRSAPRSQSAMTWSGVAETRGAALDFHTVFFSNDYEAEFEDVFRRSRPPLDPTVYICAQDRASGATPQGPERLFCLTNAPADGDRNRYTPQEIDVCRTRAVEQLARCGLSITTDLTDAVATTPTDFAKRFPQTGGALYGMASHGWQASFRRPGVTTKIPGLYLAGGSVHPGPGAPMAALSGKAAAEAILAACGSTSASPQAATPGGTSTPLATTAGTD